MRKNRSHSFTSQVLALKHRSRSDGGEPPSGGNPLPCLNSNNGADIEIIGKMQRLAAELFTPYRAKSCFVLLENAERFIKIFGLPYVGFLTLTFSDNVKDHREAYRRFKSLSKHFLSVVFGEYLLVKERQVRGAWHFHLLVQCHRDIRTGFDFDAVFPSKSSGRRPRYNSASPYLRSIWQQMRSELPKYGFGRAELAPIKSEGEAMAQYLGKYLESNLINSIEEGENATKGVRLTSASKGWAVSSPKFAWNTDGGKLWREKVAAFARAMGFNDTLGFKERYGNRWAWLFGQLFKEIDTRDMIPHDHKIDEHGAVVPDPRLQAKALMSDFEGRRNALKLAKRKLHDAACRPNITPGYMQWYCDLVRWLDLPDETVPY